MGGLNFIPVLIGLFALPELIDAAVKGLSKDKSDVHRLEGGGMTMKEFTGSLKSISAGQHHRRDPGCHPRHRRGAGGLYVL